VRDGVVLVDKPEGPTSHDVVQVARRSLDERRIGHTGTLDPFASGLMLLCVGRATRIAEFLTGLDKSYVAVARLGVTTDTLDREGKVVAEREGWQTLDERRVREALEPFVGRIQQVPPQYSARKVDGVAMHRRARRGERVELPPRPVTIYELELVEMRPPDVRLRVLCSSGTYVRSLAGDLGESLGVGAHLSALRRTSVGSFQVDDAVAIDRLTDETALAAAWLSPLEALAHLPSLGVSAEGALSLGLGQRIPAEGMDPAPSVVAAFQGELIAIGEVAEESFHPHKVFVQ
jgi:tRNA pseudouridine55 synthase